MTVMDAWKFRLLLIASFLVCSGFRPHDLHTKNSTYELQTDGLPKSVERRGNDLWITEPGPYNLTLWNDRMELGTTPQTCIGKVLVCYNSDSHDQSEVKNLCADFASTCAFYLTMSPTKFSFMKFGNDYGYLKERFQHLFFDITRDTVIFEKHDFPNCKPKLNKKRTYIQVKKASGICPLIIKNASITLREANATSVPSSKESPTPENASTTMDTWLIVVIIIAALLALGLLAGLCYCIYVCFFKKKDSKQTGTTKNTNNHAGDQTEPAKTEEIKPAKTEEVKPAKTILPVACAPVNQVQTVDAKKDEKPAPVEVIASKPVEDRPIEKTEDVATAKQALVESKEPVEPQVKTQLAEESGVKVAEAPKEPEVAIAKEAVKLEASKEPEAVVAKEAVKVEVCEKETKAATKVMERKNRGPSFPFQTIPFSGLQCNRKPALRQGGVVAKPVNQSNRSRSVKSKKKPDSLRMPLQDRYEHLIPTHIKSLSQIFGGVSGEMMIQTFKRYRRAPYVSKRELRLFFYSASKMFDELEIMGAEAEDILLKAGLVIDSKEKKIVGEIPSRVRELVANDAPEYVRHYMFALEFGNLITPNAENLNRMSLSLLFVIAIGPMFDTPIRRQAIDLLRRRQGAVQEWWTVEERDHMPFPIYALEAAYKESMKTSFASRDLKNIKTDNQRAKREKAALKKNPSTEDISREPETREGSGN